MPIYSPGNRFERGRRGTAVLSTSRSPMTELSLTSMVDMFTILVVFLLMNYSSTGEIIYIPKDVRLPKATETKELRPAHIVTLTQTLLVLDKDPIEKVEDVKNQKDWMIPSLKARLTAAFRNDEIKKKEQQTLRRSLPKSDDTSPSMKKITVQADRDLDFLTLKKVMFTVTESGAEEINFAVMKKETPKDGEAAGL